MSSSGADRLESQITKLSPEAFDRLEEIGSFDFSVSKQVVLEILRFCCQAQNEGSISAGREAFKRLPTQWLIDNLPTFLEEGISLSDDWEFRRLLEVLRQADSPLFSKYHDQGLKSDNEEIREVAADFKAVDGDSR